MPKREKQSHEKTLDEMSTPEVVTWATGTILFAIGGGETLHSAVASVIYALNQTWYVKWRKQWEMEAKKK